MTTLPHHHFDREPIHAVLLDADTLGPGLHLDALAASVDHFTAWPATSAADTAARIRDADIVISNKVPLTADLLASAPRLKLILVAATGTNNVDLSAARAQGITVCNCQSYGSESVAQHTVALMLALATQLHGYASDVDDGRWSGQRNFCLLHRPITTLAGKRLLIVGHGHIGQRVATLARAFAMDVVLAQLPWRPAQSGRVAFDTALAHADIVSLHCPQTADTERLMDADRLARMKAGSWLINVARGGLIDEPALLQALRQGPLAAAALDVLGVEPPPHDHPLLAAKLPNLLITPHTAWAALPARQALVNQLTENLRAFLRGTPQRVVSD